jgi:hypothetical protein
MKKKKRTKLPKRLTKEQKLARLKAFYKEKDDDFANGFGGKDYFLP